MTRLQHQIGKKNPFASRQEEAYLNLVRTTSLFEAEFTQLFKTHGLSPSSYNVLRILRGAGARTCGQIADDMLVRAPDVTRLADRLIASGHAERRRSDEDRRVVLIRLTPKGRALVNRLDKPIAALHEQQLGHMTAKDLDALSRLLEKARSNKE